MSGAWDTNITLVYAADDGGSTAIDLVRNGDAFDVIADIRVGRSLMQFVDEGDLFVSIRNISRSENLVSRRDSYPLVPQNSPLNQKLRVRFNAGWTANEGDVLEVIATLKVTAGINFDYSQARSAPFIVSVSL